MTAKEYLSQIRVIQLKIDQRKQQLEALYNAASGTRAITYDRDKVQVSATADMMPDAIDKIVRLQEEISALISDLEECKSEIISKIHALNDARYIEVLYMRYVEMRSIEAIACRMHYSYFRVSHIHGDALEAFRKRFLKRSKQ